MKIKSLIILMIGTIFLTSCGNNKNENKTEKIQNSTEVVSKEKSNESPKERLSKPFKDISKFAFGDNVETEVITIPDNNNNEKVTRVNVTYSADTITSEKGAIDPFLIKVFSYLIKVKEQKLDYESIFFTFKTKKTDEKYYPLVKIEITKEQADKFDFDNKQPQDLKSIAKTYDSPENKAPTNNNNDKNKEALRNVVIEQAKSSFSEFCDVETETKDSVLFIHLYPKGNLSSEIIQYLAGGNNQSINQGWDNMTEGILSASKAYNETLGENVSFVLHNPANEENIVFSTLNGVVHYNVKDDLNK